MFNQLGLIGCGLMGGSFALALKKAGLVKRVIGYSKSPSTVEKARRLGVIDIAAESALLAVSGSDIVLIAVPVAATEATFRAIYTDGNARIQLQAESLGGPINFLSDAEGRLTTAGNQNAMERPWNLWKQQAKRKT